MKISNAFPSEYLRASDLNGKSVRVVMERIEMREVGDGHKPVLFFQGKDKGMVCNKTNANNIAAAYGDDTDDWAGQSIEIFEAMVDFQGKTVPAIRVRVPRADPKARPLQSATKGKADYSEINPPPADDVTF